MGPVRQLKGSPPLSFWKEILAKMLTALIKGTEKREQYNNRAMGRTEMKRSGLDDKQAGKALARKLSPRVEWWPQRDSNPRFRLERAAS